MKKQNDIQFLSKDDLLTSSGRLESYRFSVGFAHSKGCRDEMEDVLTIETNFMNE